MTEKTSQNNASQKKRRKVAESSLNVEVYIPHDKAHRVQEASFDEWYRNVGTILEDAQKKVATESAKFVKTQEGLHMHAPIEPFNWRQDD